MAKIIKGDLKKPTRYYPWDEWLDGQQRELKRGVDFTNAARLRQSAYMAARPRGKRATVVKIDEDTVRLQAFQR